MYALARRLEEKLAENGTYVYMAGSTLCGHRSHCERVRCADPLDSCADCFEPERCVPESDGEAECDPTRPEGKFPPCSLSILAPVRFDGLGDFAGSLASLPAALPKHYAAMALRAARQMLDGRCIEHYERIRSSDYELPCTRYSARAVSYLEACATLAKISINLPLVALSWLAICCAIYCVVRCAIYCVVNPEGFDEAYEFGIDLIISLILTLRS